MSEKMVFASIEKSHYPEKMEQAFKTAVKLYPNLFELLNRWKGTRDYREFIMAGKPSFDVRFTGGIPENLKKLFPAIVGEPIKNKKSVSQLRPGKTCKTVELTEQHKTALLQTGKTHSEIAEECGISEANVHHIFCTRGVRRVANKTYKAITDFLGSKKNETEEEK